MWLDQWVAHVLLDDYCCLPYVLMTVWRVRRIMRMEEQLCGEQITLIGLGQPKHTTQLSPSAPSESNHFQATPVIALQHDAKQTRFGLLFCLMLTLKIHCQLVRPYNLQWPLHSRSPVVP